MNTNKCIFANEIVSQGDTAQLNMFVYNQKHWKKPKKTFLYPLASLNEKVNPSP